MLQKQEEAIAKKSMAMEVINTVLEAVYNSQLVDVSKIVNITNTQIPVLV